jgi:hypothetical protein
MKVIVRVETLTDCGESESVELCCVERPTSELDPRFGAGGRKRSVASQGRPPWQIGLLRQNPEPLPATL